MPRMRGVCIALVVGFAPTSAAEPYFTIQVVDEETGRGVPLVELRTVNDVRHDTDSNGVVAFLEPGLMDRDVYFHVRSHGYEYPKDGFGYAGKVLRTRPGGKAILKLRRINLAERLYRITGGGIYRDSLLVGERVPVRESALNAQVLGCDSVVTAVYRGRIHWFWGDTNRPGYPLGNFHVPGATSELPDRGRLDPDRGIDLDYFVDDDGFAKSTARMPGDGPTWIDALVTLKDAGRGERMFAAYAKVKPPLTIYERGLAEWDDSSRQFERIVVFPKDAPALPSGHPFRHSTKGRGELYFASPYPLVRVPATPDDLRNASRYEAFTCLRSGSRLDAPELDRDDHGKLRYTWKTDTPAVGPEEQRRLIRSGRLKPDEALLRLVDRNLGKPVRAHRGSVSWNAYRQRWVMIAVQSFGTSALGEVWYAEADTPLGPWGHAVKVVTHDRYSFYNPRHHPMLDRQGGRMIYFEGTYSHTFSGNDDPTPRYDYNQILYRLDLADPRLALPVPFAVRDGGLPTRLKAADLEPEGLLWDRIDFFALDRPGVKTVPIRVAEPKPGVQQLQAVTNPESNGQSPLFHALPASRKDAPPGTVALWEYVNPDKQIYAYSTDPRQSPAGFRRNAAPLCLVWSVPTAGDKSP